MPGLLAYLWRLVPGNPILRRVVALSGKRRNGLFVRSGYLAFLIVLVLLAFATADAGGGDLDQLTRVSTDLFVNLSYLQLACVSLIAPIFTAGAITQERDGQSYDILLSTPLTNGQVVLGTLLSRVFLVIALIVGGIPVFGITQIFGGVSFSDVALSALIAAATALIVGSVATAIASLKVGSRRTILGFYVAIAAYVVGGFTLDATYAGARPDLLDAATGTYTRAAQTSWVTPFHPFLALRSVLDPVGYAPPTAADLPPHLQGWLVRPLLTTPATAFLVLSAVVSLLLIVPSIVLLRRVVQVGVTPAAWARQRLATIPGFSAAAARRPRTVWSNPIAWREARTRGGTGRNGILRVGLSLIGVALGLTCAILYATPAGLPRTYVDRGGLDDVSRTAFLRGDRGGTYALADYVEVTVDGEPAAPADVSRRLAVATSTNISVIDGRPTITRLDLSEPPRRLEADTARQLLLGLILLEVAAILLVVTNAAASTVTREREDGTLDLLLGTPVTSRYYIWGKLRGLVTFVVPLVFVPVSAAAAFVLVDLLVVRGAWLVLPEAVVLMPLLLIVTAAFAGVTGMNLSLRTRSTVRSVMASLGIVLGLFGVLGWCGVTLAEQGGIVGLVFAAFSPLSVLVVLISPGTFAGAVGGADGQVGRFVLFVFAIGACGLYALGVWGLYRSMVTNFDMTIRRQQQ